MLIDIQQQFAKQGKTGMKTVCKVQGTSRHPAWLCHNKSKRWFNIMSEYHPHKRRNRFGWVGAENDWHWQWADQQKATKEQTIEKQKKQKTDSRPSRKHHMHQTELCAQYAMGCMKTKGITAQCGSLPPALQQTPPRQHAKLKYRLVLSGSAFFTITIVAEAILTIVDSFMIVCFPIMNLLILLVGLCSSVLSLHCSIFMEVVSLKIEPHIGCTNSILSIDKQILHVAYVVYFCPLLVSTNLVSMPKQRQTSIIAP